MSLSVSYKQNIGSGIDTASLREVTQQIFQRANSNSALSNLDLTKFNRPTLGKDFYSGKVDASTARQIAITNSGIQVNLSDNALNSLRYLNSEASKSIFNKSVDGRINIAETKEISEKTGALALPSFGRLIETADLDSDKRGSNPFYKGELLNATEKKEKEEVLNIFA